MVANGQQLKYVTTLLHLCIAVYASHLILTVTTSYLHNAFSVHIPMYGERNSYLL